MARDPTTRFSDRVDAYLRYRPTYPDEVFELLTASCDLGRPRTIADIGSGTGILTRLFLERGHSVWAVEPNLAMRSAAERLLVDFADFTSVDGTAEETGLASECVHLIASGQAFHWFDLAATRDEFRRILEPDGWVVILWNDRRKSATAFLRAYEELLVTHGTDYELVDHTRIGQHELRAFFGTDGFTVDRFENRQMLDRAALRGRVESCSYVPRTGDPGYPAMLEGIHGLFDAHNVGGAVSLDYDTLVYIGRMS